MSTQGKIKTLYSDREQTEAIFPRTTTNAIFDEDGVGLEAILSTTVHAKEEFENNSEVTLNDADTFGGNTPDYFASAEDLQEVNSKIDTLVFPVKSVNLKTGNVTLTAADVGAVTEAFVKNEIANAKLDNSGSGVDLSGYATKDDLNNLATKDEVNAINFPVDSVNGKTGAVKLSASDVGAATSDHTHSYAGSSSVGGAATSANKVNKNLVVKLNSGSTEGTNLFTFNGSTAKTVNITPSTIGAAASSHNHAASNITSGTLGVARGGTGLATHTANAVLTGNGTSAVKNVATASGALYATKANGAAKFGILPLAQGGTGMTSASSTSLSNGAFYYHLAKFGNLVVCTLLPKAKRSTPLYDTSVTIPSGYRPKANLTFTIFSTVNVNAGSDGYANINVNTNGVFKFNTSYGISIEEAAGTYCWVSA